jgi:hypothetical protein
MARDVYKCSRLDPKAAYGLSSARTAASVLDALSRLRFISSR